ncbi:hypothetical protein Sjap_025490 [Stephania japonica]|uniref:FBD domain-containing protein n=1 Tax=Stephania japonica TaxID=461633 RepID=A0AAP0HFP8_9MAGN
MSLSEVYAASKVSLIFLRFLLNNAMHLQQFTFATVHAEVFEKHEVTRDSILNFDFPDLLPRSLMSMLEIVNVKIGVSRDCVKVNTNRIAIDVLQLLRNAISLELRKFGAHLGTVPFSLRPLGDALQRFTNLKSLKLNTTIEESGFILSKCSSSVEDLSLKSIFILQADVVLPKQCSLNNLNYVAIRSLSRGKTELQFLRFLLNSAKHLKLVTFLVPYPRKGYDKHEVTRDSLLNFDYLELLHDMFVAGWGSLSCVAEEW